MPLILYNTFTKQDEPLVPRTPGTVTMYTCGPTVYGRPHIGNYASFLMADLLRRWLEAGHSYRVTHVKNITDVGHLVADADDGEDKVQREAEKEKINPLAIAERYTAMYLEDEQALRMLEPAHRPRASAYVQEMIAIITTLIAKHHAYETEDGVYFAVQSFPAYGNLSGNTLDKLAVGARISVDEAKHHPADFALWKKCVGRNAHHILRWPSPWGEGFPGWHIECSAMSSSLLGEEIDIHTGGEDNIFPHHECEIAQSECASGHRFVRHWLHRRRIDLAGEKMSKSLGNVLSLPDIVAKGYSPLDLRYLFLSVHYRTNLKFSFEGLDAARKARHKIVEWIDECTGIPLTSLPAHTEGAQQFFDAYIAPLIDRFTASMDSDLNTSSAIASIFDLMSITRRAYESGYFSQKTQADLLTFLTRVRHTFGCFDSEVVTIPSAVQALVDARTLARKKKDFAESDRLRDEIKKLGYEVRDTGTEQVVKKL